MLNVAGKAAVVTGAAGGLGLGLARTLARRGAGLVLADIAGEAALERAAAQVRGLGADVLAVRADVTDADAVHELASPTVARFGSPFVVCSNAGSACTGRHGS